VCVCVSVCVYVHTYRLSILVTRVQIAHELPYS